MEGMPIDETIWRLMANNGVYTNALAEVVEISKGRFCRMKLVSATEEEFDLPLVNVPVGRLIGTSQAIKKGMIIPIMFSKYALDKIFVDKEKASTKGPLEDLQFDRDNAYALPIVFDDKLDLAFPNTFTVHENAIFEAPVNMLDTLEVLKAVTMKKTLDVDEVITSLQDVVAITVSLLNHIHKETKPGAPGEFSGPPQE